MNDDELCFKATVVILAIVIACACANGCDALRDIAAALQTREEVR